MYLQVCTPSESFILLRAGIWSVNTRIAIDNKLDNHIFENGQSAPWKIKTHHLLSLNGSLDFFSFNTYTAACAYRLEGLYLPHQNCVHELTLLSGYFRVLSFFCTTFYIINLRPSTSAHS